MSTASSDQTNNDHSTILNDTILHEDDLTEQAKKHFPYHSDIFRAFESYRQSVLRNEHMTPVGRTFFLSELQNLHTDCKRVLNYSIEHNKFVDQNLPTIGPLLVCGLARTGTTLLYNLLACDPQSRAPLYTDMCIDVVPPIARSDSIGQNRRMDILNSEKNNEQLTDLLIRIASSHARFPIEEDTFIIRQAGYLSIPIILSDNDDDDAENWISNEISKDYAYDYHEIFLRMLNSVDMPKSHWLLKSPFHIFYLDKLLQHYPNALLIITHRNLDEVLPSMYSLFLAAADLYFDKTNSISRDRIMKRVDQYLDKGIEYIMKFRNNLQNDTLKKTQNNILDISYENLMKDPIGVVKQIHDHFNFHWSDEMEMAMRNWLLENPQGKQGRHKYSLADFGLTREDLERRYADYNKLFLSSTYSNNQSSSTNLAQS
ncbi:unnamed protein product [Rotaria sordida]|uniref:Sulfotransferase n=1 Tax=Rotaria sordida TaxID=392033 RepID=A0A819PLN9_9BILA|nr:unnamed protein product [Rotaria sordida]CAF4015377.1 unnamed protein product [Rotaria sordida]